MSTTLKQTNNSWTCIGTVYEKKLKKEIVTIEAGPKDAKEKVQTECVKGSVAVRIPDGVVTFPVYFTQIGYNGEESYSWAMASAMFDKWNPEVNGDGSEPTRVALNGELGYQDKFNERTNKVDYYLSYRIRSANTKVSDDMVNGFTIKTNAFVQKVNPEVKDDEETGRLLVDLLCVDFKGGCYPIRCIVDEDGAELITDGDSDFDAFEAGQTRTGLEIEYHLKGVEKKASTTTRRTFGKKTGPDVYEGGSRSIVELMLVSADAVAVEEPDELTYEDENGNEVEVETLWINPKTMKEAIKVRKAMLEELEQNGGKKEEKTTTKNVGKKLSEAKKKKPVEDDFASEDDPF